MDKSSMLVTASDAIAETVQRLAGDQAARCPATLTNNSTMPARDAVSPMTP